MHSHICSHLVSHLELNHEFNTDYAVMVNLVLLFVSHFLKVSVSTSYDMDPFQRI